MPFTFRLPCPPAWDDRAPGAWAAERRARRAYFAALDSLRTGVVNLDDEAKTRRLLHDLRSPLASAAVRHLLRIFDGVRRAAGPMIDSPDEPLAEVTIIAPPVTEAHPDPVWLEARYRWALDWLDARRFVVGKGLDVQWRVRRMTLAGVVVVPASASASPTKGPRASTTAARPPRRPGPRRSSPR